MRIVELSDEEWAHLKRRLTTRSADEALKDYAPPVKLTHGSEYVTYEKGNEDDSESDN